MIERPKILLVDDRRENLLALEAVLQDIEVEILTSESADEALLLVLRHEFTVILLDVEMPGMDGFEMARLIRQRPRTRHTPIIFVTAVDRGESLVIEGYSLGAVDFLIKPFAPDILRWKVQVFADLYRRAQESQELIREQTIRATREEWSLRRARNTCVWP